MEQKSRESKIIVDINFSSRYNVVTLLYRAVVKKEATSANKSRAEIEC